MSIVCYPPDTDYSCAFTPEELDEIAASPELEARLTRASGLAWMSLMALSGGQIGYCPITVRPCSAGCGAPGTWMVAPVLSSGRFAGVRPGVYAFAPHISASGAWVNSCGCSSDGCGCSALPTAILPGPVGGVVSVWLNGVELPADAYAIVDGNRLVRLDGEGWPACQDLTQDAQGPDAFSVQYYLGAAPDNVTLAAGGKLAKEFYLACGGQDCALPANVVSVSRQGISMELSGGLFPNGKTNILEVDALLEIYNPHGLRSAPVIASPDTMRRPRMTTVGRR